jgi:hypothetical protein
MHKHILYELAIGVHSEAHRAVGPVAADIFIRSRHINSTNHVTLTG